MDRADIVVGSLSARRRKMRHGETESGRRGASDESAAILLMELLRAAI